MGLEDEPPGHNRLERLGIPGYGENPDTPKDVRPRQHNRYSPVNDDGIDLEGDASQGEYGSQFGAPPRREEQVSPTSQEPSRTVYTLIAAGAIAIGSLLGNYVQSEKLSESEEMRQSLQGGLQRAVHRYDVLEKEYSKERTARRSAELTTRLQEADVARMRQESERVQEAYPAKMLEAQRPLPENGDRVSDNANDGGRLRSGEGTRVND